MRRLKCSISYCLPAALVCFILMAAKVCVPTPMFLCRHTYALCTSARCIPLPDNSTLAMCTCDVEEGLSMSTMPCCRLEPSIGACGMGVIFSTFSFKQLMQGNKVMKCPPSTPMSWCLNKPCTIDPCDPTKAICMCDVVHPGEDWVTFGGSCNTSTCKNAFWSGASMQDFNDGNVFMMKQLNLNETPVKWCQYEVSPK